MSEKASKKDAKSKDSKKEEKKKDSKDKKSEKDAGTPKKSKKDSDKSSKKSKSKKGDSPAGNPFKFKLVASRGGADFDSEFKSQPDFGHRGLDIASGVDQIAGGPPFGGPLRSGGPEQFMMGPVMGGQYGQQQQQADPPKGQCFLHQKSLRYFCDSCEELICYDCTVMGPHNTQLHRISSIEEAFRFRFEYVNRAIHQTIVPKRAQLIGQIVRLDQRIEEVKHVKGGIERDIRSEYGAIMERLKSCEGVKLAILQHDIAEIQKDITRIDEILMTMEEVTKSSGGPSSSFMPDLLGFLHKYRQLMDNIEYAQTKHFKMDIEVVPNDLPRELTDRRALLEHYEEQRRWSKFKDDVIWKLSQELKQKYDYFQDEFDKETRHEMNEWARLVDRYASELKKYELVCAYCGQHLADTNVNSDCPENGGGMPANAPTRGGYGGSTTGGRAGFQSQTLPPQPGQDPGSVYYTEDDPPPELTNTRRHFFGHPSLKGYKQNPFRTQTASLLKEEVILQNPEAAKVLRKIYEMEHTMKMDLDSKFRAFDPNNVGIIKKNDFINVISENVKSISGSELVQFMGMFTTSFDDVVSYPDFLNILYKFGDMPTPPYQDYSPQPSSHEHYSNALTQHVKDALLQKLEVHEREFIERLREQLRGKAVGDALKKFARDNKDLIGENELALGLYNTKAPVQLSDVQDLYNLMRTKFRQGKGDQVSIAEVVAVLGGTANP